MPVIHLTWPDCTVRKMEVLGQFQVVHIGFRLICVVSPYVIQRSYYDNQWVLQYIRQFWADGENFQYYKRQGQIEKVNRLKQTNYLERFVSELINKRLFSILRHHRAVFNRAS